jgi:hypothetical protein
MSIIGLIILVFVIFAVGYGIYLIINKIKTLYFSKSFMIGDDEYAYQTLEMFDNFKNKINEIDEEDNDILKNIKETVNKNSDSIYPKLKDNYVIIWKCGRDTTFNNISKNLLYGKVEHLIARVGIYKKSNNDLQLISFTQSGGIIFTSTSVENDEIRNMKEKLNQNVL